MQITVKDDILSLSKMIKWTDILGWSLWWFLCKNYEGAYVVNSETERSNLMSAGYISKFITLIHAKYISSTSREPDIGSAPA